MVMQGIPHRYLTECYYGIGGRIKSELDDFQVTEVPLYQPSDHGEHSYFEIEKRDFSTLEAVGTSRRRCGPIVQSEDKEGA